MSFLPFYLVINILDIKHNILWSSYKYLLIEISLSTILLKVFKEFMLLVMKKSPFHIFAIHIVKEFLSYLFTYCIFKKVPGEMWGFYKGIPAILFMHLLWDTSNRTLIGLIERPLYFLLST